jgi:hypothetical protein
MDLGKLRSCGHGQLVSFRDVLFVRTSTLMLSLGCCFAGTVSPPSSPPAETADAFDFRGGILNLSVSHDDHVKDI